MANETIDGKTRSRLILAARLAAVLLLIALLMRCNEQRSAIANALPDPKAASTPPASGEPEAAATWQAAFQQHAALPAGKKLLARNHVVAPEALAGDPGVFARHADTPAMEDPMTPEAGDGDGEGASGDAPLSLADGGDGGFFHMGPGSAVRSSGGGSAFGGSGGGSGGGSNGDGSNCDKAGQCGTPASVPAPPMLIAVPEPSTWLLILAGFFSLGALLRVIRQSIVSAPRRPHAD